MADELSDGELRKIDDEHFWFGDILVDIVALNRHSLKPNTRPWGHGHKIMHTIGTLRGIAEYLNKDKPIYDGLADLAKQQVELLQEYGYLP